MILIADTSPLISLILTGKLSILDKLFGQYFIPKTVWDELNTHNEILNFKDDLLVLSSKIRQTQSFFIEISGIDKGETEAIILYKELNANLLLVDDKKARAIAELMDVKCTGTLAILYEAKQKGIVDNLKPIFQLFIDKKRHYSKIILNELLIRSKEELI
jgi:uncharacterized protein